VADDLVQNRVRKNLGFEKNLVCGLINARKWKKLSWVSMLSDGSRFLGLTDRIQKARNAFLDLRAAQVVLTFLQIAFLLEKNSKFTVCRYVLWIDLNSLLQYSERASRESSSVRSKED
jgi:hypothetical protein